MKRSYCVVNDGKQRVLHEIPSNFIEDEDSFPHDQGYEVPAPDVPRIETVCCNNVIITDRSNVTEYKRKPMGYAYDIDCAEIRPGDEKQWEGKLND